MASKGLEVANCMREEEECARQRDCMGRELEVRKSDFSHELRGDLYGWREVSLLREDHGQEFGFYPKCHQTVLWLRVSNMNSLSHTFRDYLGF